MTRNAQSVFQQVCELDEDQRSAKLAELCGDDPSLRSEVESLLGAHDAAGEFMNEPTMDHHGSLSSGRRRKIDDCLWYAEQSSQCAGNPAA